MILFTVKHVFCYNIIHNQLSKFHIDPGIIYGHKMYFILKKQLNNPYI